ncbi:hypothetical protein BMS3Bbin15_00961 [archaeon BMS3Bbin15]|nr:hypothetical protein BMS3Bbin15_00961 [archaeon BMS3Bbin15]
MTSGKDYVKKGFEDMEKWGYSRNPYLHHPLEKKKEFDSLFVGREKEIRNFFKKFVSGTHAFCIEGSFGVGKSTFKNRCFSEIKVEENRDVFNFIITDTISVVETESPREFLIDILRVTLDSIKPYREYLKEKNKKTLFEIENIVTKGDAKGNSYGSNIPIIHGQRESTSSTSVQPMNLLTQDFIINRLIKIGNIVREDLKARILITLNNLEKEKVNDQGKITTLIEMLRGLIFSEFILIFIGDLQLKSRLTSSGRLRSVFGESIELSPLSLDEFQFAVDRRLKYSAIKENYAPPLGDDVLEYMFSKCGGDIRWAFNFLNNVFEEIFLEDYPIRTYSLSDIEPICIKISRNTFNGLDTSEQKVIRAFSTIKSASPSDKKLQRACGVTRSTLQKILSDLSKRPELIVRGKRDRKQVYSLGYEMGILSDSENL